MGFFCAPVLAAEERCRSIKHSVLKEGFFAKHCFLEQIFVSIKVTFTKALSPYSEFYFLVLTPYCNIHINTRE